MISKIRKRHLTFEVHFVRTIFEVFIGVFSWLKEPLLVRFH